jgi:hypothetical protein
LLLHEVAIQHPTDRQGRTAKEDTMLCPKHSSGLARVWLCSMGHSPKSKTLTVPFIVSLPYLRDFKERESHEYTPLAWKAVRPEQGES